MSISRPIVRIFRPPTPFFRASYATIVRNRPVKPSSLRSSVKRPPPVPLSKRPSQRPNDDSISSSQHDRTQSSASDPIQLSKSDSKQSSIDAISIALRDASTENNNLLAPVNIPKDPYSILDEGHPAASILANSGIVVTRQLELMNVMLGFEQANKYVIMDPQGNHIGYMAERDLGVGSTMKRQFFSTHRSFTTHVFDKHQKEVLRFHRPFSWISSRIGVYDPVDPSSSSNALNNAVNTSSGALTTEVNPETAQVSQLPLSDMRIIGESQQFWAPLRRKYNLFIYRGDAAAAPDTPQLTSGDLPLSNSKQLQPVTSSESNPSAVGEYSQFAYIDERFLSWDFSLFSYDKRLLGSVNRNFAGFGREIFTDTGVYALRMDAANLAEEPGHLISKTGKTDVDQRGMTLDQRAVMLATAVSVDFDYFSRHSGSTGIGGGFIPLWFPGMGGGGAAAEAGAEAGGVIEGAEGAGSVLGRTGAGNVGEGASVGAAGAGAYEVMQGRGAYGDDASPTDGQVEQEQPGQVGQGEDTWGNEEDPWGGGEGDGGGGGDGGDFDWF